MREGREEKGLRFLPGQEPWLRKASLMVVSEAQTTCDHRSRNLCVRKASEDVNTKGAATGLPWSWKPTRAWMFHARVGSDRGGEGNSTKGVCM